ncbi:MAG: sugar phosphate isomerase/epimerase [Phycisphaerales bacterium]|nr:sugar phosphate isomerase/epimerase [Phycisphaerales bacterium]MCB9862153.1 sugar phosphate isomerase/epimerase [Phycisphaerales bacterium]
MSNAQNRLSVCTDDLRLEIKRALQTASALGFRTVDIGATGGAVHPRQMSKSAQRHLSRYLSDLGLRLGSLRGPVAGSSYGDGSAGEHRLEMMRSIIAMAGEMRVPVVSTSLGGFVGDADAEANSRLLEAVETLANDSYRHGVRVAIETTGVSPEALRGLISGLDCPTLGVCCDSGAMLMEGNDPHRVAENLAGRIHVVRARDATFGSPTAAGREVAMGEGALDIPAFVASLQEAGFSGDMIVSRSDSVRPSADLSSAGKILGPYLIST